MKIRLLFIVIFFLSYIPLSHSQVTIGSDLEPREGLLLDLKEDKTTGREPNSTKGLGLPRVELSSLNILTIDDSSKNDDYVGITVYNVVKDIEKTDIKEGIYSWDGTQWMQVVTVDDYGMDEQLLRSNGDGTFGWTTFIPPTFSFHKPTQIVTFDQAKVIPITPYSYQDIISINKGNSVYAPKEGLFDNDFVYSETLNIQSDMGKDKYLLFGMIGYVRLTTIDNRTTPYQFWQTIKIDIYVDDTEIKTYERLYSSAANADLAMYINIFSIISLNDFNIDKGIHTIKVRISNVSNTFPANEGYGTGQFHPSTSEFYQVSMRDFNFVLYEDE